MIYYHAYVDNLDTDFGFYLL